MHKHLLLHATTDILLLLIDKHLRMEGLMMLLSMEEHVVVLLLLLSVHQALLLKLTEVIVVWTSSQCLSVVHLKLAGKAFLEVHHLLWVHCLAIVHLEVRRIALLLLLA